MPYVNVQLVREELPLTARSRIAEHADFLVLQWPHGRLTVADMDVADLFALSRAIRYHADAKRGRDAAAQDDLVAEAAEEEREAARRLAEEHAEDDRAAEEVPA